MTGEYETSKFEEFTYGIGNRAASVRIPTFTASEKKGYIEDRRPASNLDPYLACTILADAALKDESLCGDLVRVYRKWAAWKETVKFE